MDKSHVGHIHHYSKSVLMVWDPKTKLVSPQFHAMFENNFDTVQAPDPNITHTDTMDRLLKKTAINMMILLEMNTPIYFLTGGGGAYTQTTKHQTLKHAKNR
jgi:hypothetical protein